MSWKGMRSDEGLTEVEGSNGHQSHFETTRHCRLFADILDSISHGMVRKKRLKELFSCSS